MEKVRLFHAGKHCGNVTEEFMDRLSE